MTTPDKIKAKYHATVQPILGRLTELHEDDERVRSGLNRNIPEAQVRQERETLMRQFAYADSEATSAMQAWLAESQSKVDAARATPLGDEQERMVDMMAADQLTRQHDAADLVGRARQALSRGDHRTALVHLNAARLTAQGKRVHGLAALAADLDATLDTVVPARAAALEANKADRFEYAADLIERVKHRQLTALLTGDRATATRAGASAKLKAFDLATAKGETYEDTVELEPVGGQPKMSARSA